MRPGTPKFVGARLKEAREARGLTAISLAEIVGVSRQAISQYEHGSVSPHPEVMRKIAATVNLPFDFFWRPLIESEMAPSKVFFRSFSAATKTQRNRGSIRLKWLKNIAEYLQQFVEFPPINLPDFNMPSNPNVINNHQIENLARDVRRFWGLGDGVISNVVRLLEKNGVIIARDYIGADSIDAFSEWEEGQRPYIILSSDKCSSARSRFDVAHELAHLILHRNVDKKILNKASEFKLMEDQANYFAAAFLLPEETFAKDCYFVTLDVLRTLKAKWVLSIGMMLQRSKQIGLCSEEQLQQLWRLYSRRGWKKREPLDDELPIEEPHLLRLSFELIISRNIQTRNDVLHNLPYTAADIEELAGLSPGYLSDAQLEIRLSSNIISRNKVVNFPPDKNKRLK